MRQPRSRPQSIARTPERAQVPCAFLLTLTYMDAGHSTAVISWLGPSGQKSHNRRFKATHLTNAYGAIFNAEWQTQTTRFE